MSLKYIIKKIARKCVYGAAENSISYVAFLRKMGISIGEGTVFYDPTTTTVDTQNPKLLKIGNNVRITKGVTILTHDYSWAVLSGVYGECLGGIGEVIIGDNVFIGVNAVVLKGVKIGENVIIGAGSVVSNNCDSNSVYAGVPARKICSIEQFYQKKKERLNMDIHEILKNIDSSSEEDLKRYLREYSCILENDIFSEKERQKLMRDTGYFETCEKFYSQAKKSRVSDFI